MSVNGQLVFEAFIIKTKNNPNKLYKIMGGLYDTQSHVIMPEDIENFKNNMLNDPNFREWAMTVMGGYKPRVLDMCGSGKEFINEYSTRKENPNIFTEVNNEKPKFDKLFPECLPFAAVKNEDGFEIEFFFVDTRYSQYPVLFWNHECIVKVSKDIQTFLDTVGKDLTSANE